MERRLPQFCFALSLIVLALMLGAIWQAGTPAWKTYQQEFHRLEAGGEPNAEVKTAVLQVVRAGVPPARSGRRPQRRGQERRIQCGRGDQAGAAARVAARRPLH